MWGRMLLKLGRRELGEDAAEVWGGVGEAAAEVWGGVGEAAAEVWGGESWGRVLLN